MTSGGFRIVSGTLAKWLLLKNRRARRIPISVKQLRCCVIATGLWYKYVLPTSLARSAATVHAVPQQERNSTPQRQLGAILDPGHVFPQRKGGALPYGYGQESNAQVERHRTFVVRQQVRWSMSPHPVSCFIIRSTAAAEQCPYSITCYLVGL